MIDSFIEGNKIFQEKDFERKKERYMQLTTSQHPTVLWIGCSDSRVNPERITHCRAGELFTHRNIGNIVPTHDWNFATVLEYAVNHLKVQDIVVCGHSDCGALNALDVDMSKDSYIPLWINNAREAQIRVDERLGEAKTPSSSSSRRRIFVDPASALDISPTKTPASFSSDVSLQRISYGFMQNFSSTS